MSEFEFAYQSIHNHPRDKDARQRRHHQRYKFGFRFRDVPLHHGFLWERLATRYEMAAGNIHSAIFSGVSTLNFTDASSVKMR